MVIHNPAQPRLYRLHEVSRTEFSLGWIYQGSPVYQDPLMHTRLVSTAKGKGHTFRIVSAWQSDSMASGRIKLWKHSPLKMV